MDTTLQHHSSWVSRVKLLDDLPTKGDASSDILGMDPLARSLAYSLMRNAGGPMVVHVDGAWGRGKTSFCRMLESRLLDLQGQLSSSEDPSEAQDVSVAWYVASDAEPAGQRAVMYQVLRAVLAEDPEEITSLMNHFNVDDYGVGEPTFDRFRSWLEKELGWTAHSLHSSATAISLETSVVSDDFEQSRDVPNDNEPTIQREDAKLQLDYGPRRRKLAVVVVDDLDRCAPEWVALLLDTIRRYVTCKGVSFVIAADRKVIETAFRDVVVRLGVAGARSGAEALEKYVRHTVRMPQWRFDVDRQLGRKLAALQQGLSNTASALPLLSAPTMDLKPGVAFKLALYLPSTLSVRRLKRVLNGFAVSVARFADFAEIRSEDLSHEPLGRAWLRLPECEPVFGTPAASHESYVGYFFGQLIVVTLEEAWPAVLADLPLDSDEFRQRVCALALLGTGLRSKEGTPPVLSLKLFQIAVDAIVDAEQGDSIPIEVKREVCEFIASVYADLGRDGRFVPRRAHVTESVVRPPSRESPQPAVESSTQPPEAADQEDGAASGRSPTPAAKGAPANVPASRKEDDVDRLQAVADELLDLFPIVEGAPDTPHAEVFAHVIEIAQGVQPKPPSRLEEALRRYSQIQWPVEAVFGAVEYARELNRLGFAPDAFALLTRCYGTVEGLRKDAMHNSQIKAFLWAATEALAALAAEHRYLAEKLARLPSFPPRQDPDCAAAWRSALKLLELTREQESQFDASPWFEHNLTTPLANLAAAFPGFAWPARLLLKLVNDSDSPSQSAVRSIGERILAGGYGLSGDREVDLVLAAARRLRDSPSDQDLAIRLYDLLLRNMQALPASELHPLALLYRENNQPVEAGLHWEHAYRLGALDSVAEREFLLLLEDQGRADIASSVLAKRDLGKERPFGPPLPPAVVSEPTGLDHLAVDYVLSPLELLRELRPQTFTDQLAGPLGELVARLFEASSAQGVKLNKLRAEATAWVGTPMPAGSRLAVELSRVMADLELSAEARALLASAQDRLDTETPETAQLKWDLIAQEVAVVGRENLRDELQGDLPPQERPTPNTSPPLSLRSWSAAVISGTAGQRPMLAAKLLNWTMDSVTARSDSVPPRLREIAIDLLAASPAFVNLPDQLALMLQDAWAQELHAKRFIGATRGLLLAIPVLSQDATTLLVNAARAGFLAGADYDRLASTAPVGEVRLNVQATAYAAGIRGAWVSELASSLPEGTEEERQVKDLVQASEDAPNLGEVVELYPLAEDADG